MSLNGVNRFLIVAFATFTFLYEFPLVMSKNKLELSYNNCTCTPKDDGVYIKKIDCYVGKVSRRRGFFIELQLKADVKMFKVNILLSLPRKDSEFVILDLKNISGCDLLSNRNQVTFMSMIRQMLDRYSNLPRGCPLKKDTAYYVRGFRLDMSVLPALSFETYVNTLLEFTVYDKVAVAAFIQGHTYVKGKADSKIPTHKYDD